MKVAIITPILAHYRGGLYKTLDTTEDIEFVHYADPHDPRRGVKSLHPGEVRSFRALHNKTVGRATWQVGAVRAALNREFEAYIFTGDASFLSTWVAACIARARQARVYFWTIGWTRPDKGVKRLTRLAFYRLANRLLVYTPRNKQLGIDSGYPSDRMSVIYNSVTQASGVGHSRSRTPEQPVLRLGAVARLAPRKGFSLLIDAAEILQRSGHPVRVLIGGEGPERAKLQRRAESLGVDCRFFGELYDEEELGAFYDELMVTVVPAATGLTAIQSLSYGIPVITNDDFDTQGPEVAAVREGVTGSLYKKDDVSDLVRTIRFWAAKMSEDRDVVSADCHAEVAARWSFDAQAKYMLATISDDVPRDRRRTGRAVQ